MSSTTTMINQKRLSEVAQVRGLRLNSDKARVDKVNSLMAALYDETGAWICPCKKKVPRPDGVPPVTCPCPELDDEISAQGFCCCRVFYAPEP